MMTEYYIINPTGNITALVTSPVAQKYYKPLSRAIMQNHPEIEQVGFVDFSGKTPRLRMAGGEFCGNATLSTAALFCEIKGLKSADIPVSVFGTENPVSVQITAQNGVYRGVGSFPKPQSLEMTEFEIGENSYRLPIVGFGGIIHIIADKKINIEIAGEILKKYAKILNSPAMGVMIYDPRENSLCPLVYVPECDTLIRENSCVSGSIAVATYLLSKNQPVDIVLKQPGGELFVSATNQSNEIKLKGTIKIEKHIKEEINYE